MTSPTHAISMHIVGLDAFLVKLGVLGAKAATVGGAALYREAEGIMNTAKGLTPVDTGALRASGHVNPPDVSGGKVSVELGFGGAAEAYAVYVHEMTWVGHRVGQAKFLEQPLLEWAANGGVSLAKHLGPALEGI